MSETQYLKKPIILYNSDNTPMTKKQVILIRRGAFIFLPVMFSNDLVCGSFYFALGSFISTSFSIYPLLINHIGEYSKQDDILPNNDYDITWILLIISGLFFTFGSLLFMRAFTEPFQKPLFENFKHLQTDELFASWLFLIGTTIYIPYSLIFFIIIKTSFYFLLLCVSIMSSICCYFFVISCYPRTLPYNNLIFPFLQKIFGTQIFFVKHFQNDWLASQWIFYVINIVIFFTSLIIFIMSLLTKDIHQIFIWLCGTSCSLLFLIGSMYFIAGSYPNSKTFTYNILQETKNPLINT